VGIVPDGATRPDVYTDAMPHARRSGPTLGQSLAKYWWLVGLVAIAFGTLGFLWSSEQDRQYTATTRLFLSHSSGFDGFGQSDFVANPDRFAVNQATLATSRPVLARAVADGDLAVEVDDLGRAVVITAGRGNDVIIIDATAETPRLAARYANAVSAAYQALRLEEVERQTELLTELSTSDAEQATVLKRAAVYGNGIELVEEATPPENPSSPQPRRDALLALLVGAVVGTALAAGLDRLRGREPDRDETRSTVTRRERRQAAVPDGATPSAPGQPTSSSDSASHGTAPRPADEPVMVQSTGGST
jgi:uncharacterized protein involved in exopolysaccharide biosynthesis